MPDKTEKKEKEKKKYSPERLAIAARLKVYRETHVDLTQKEFAAAINHTQDWCSKSETGVTPMSAKKCIKIIRVYKDLSLNWLLTGHGYMLLDKKDQTTPSIIAEEQPIYVKGVNIPVPLAARPQYLTTNGKLPDRVKLPDIIGEARTFEVAEGELPAFQGGDYAVAEKVTAAEVVDNHLYAIVYKGELAFKHLFHKKSKFMLVCPNNKEHPVNPYQTSLTEIWHIVQKITDFGYEKRLDKAQASSLL